MTVLQNLWVQISVAAGAAPVVIKCLQHYLINIKKLNRDSIDHLAKYLNKPIADMSQNEKLLQGEAVRYFYKTRRLSVRDLTVLVKAEDPNLAIDCFLRYCLYLEIKNDKVIHKEDAFKKMKIDIKETPFYQIFVMSFVKYLLFSYIGLFLVYIAWNEFYEIDVFAASLNASLVSDLLQVLLALSLAICVFIPAYFALEGFGAPPSERYVSRVFLEGEKASHSQSKNGFLSIIRDFFFLDLADRD